MTGVRTLHRLTKLEPTRKASQTRLKRPARLTIADESESMQKEKHEGYS